MALWIHNITEGDVPDDGLHSYRVMINQEELCRFEHVRDHGAAECLRLAAEALEEAEGLPTPTVIKRQVMAVRRAKLRSPNDKGED